MAEGERERKRTVASYQVGAETTTEGGSGVETDAQEVRTEHVENGPGDGDVVLRVPHLKVEEVTVEVGKLEAHLSLSAQLAGLLRLNAGVDLDLDDVKISIKGVEAEAHLRVYLDKVERIIDRTVSLIESNPEAVTEIIKETASSIEDGVDGGGGRIRRMLPGGEKGD